MAARTKRHDVDGRSLSIERLESRNLLTTVSLSPVADTYVGSGVGSEAADAEVLDVLDYGTSGSDRIAYIRFDLSGYSLSDMTSATLTLYKQSGTRSDTIVTGRFEVYGLTNARGNTEQDWSESTLNLSTVGAEYTNVGGDLIDTSKVFNLDADSGADVIESVNSTIGGAQTLSGADLISFLETRIADDGLVTFITLVDAGDSNRGWGYGSSENADQYLRPELTITSGGEDPYPANPVSFSRQVEDLDRGVVAVKRSSARSTSGGACWAPILATLPSTSTVRLTAAPR